MNRFDPRSRVVDWLVSGPGDRDQALTELRRHGVTVLRLGGLFDAVRIPQHLVHAAVGSRTADNVDSYLVDTLAGGPVIRDADVRRYYALVPAGTSNRWNGDTQTPCLGAGTFLGVPHPGRTHPDDRWRSYWSVPMRQPGVLCRPGAVLHVVTLGLARCGSVM